METKVALIDIGEDVDKSFMKALKLLGGIDDLNTKEREVVIKVGIFNPKAPYHTSPDVLGAITKRFIKAPHIFVAESDNYRGKAHERLSVYKEIYSKRITPFSLSDDPETEEVRIADEKLNFSRILFKPNVLVSTHVLRTLNFMGSQWGGIVKNLLGLVPDHKKARFHKRLPEMLFDAYEAIGGIDLAVVDGTYAHLDCTYVHPDIMSTKIRTNLLIVGRDAVAIDTISAILLGGNLKKMPVLRKAKKRNIGTWDINKIEVVGSSLEEEAKRVQKLKVKKRTSAK
jgi:uncharacterized protein (DUF362 family)